MYINLLLSKLPTQSQFQQIFKELGFDGCHFIQNDDWENAPNNDNTVFIHRISPYHHQKWQYYLEIIISDRVVGNEKWLYFSIVKKIGELTSCDILCHYYDNDIINGNIHNDPYYDFAFIDNGWYLINDIEMFDDDLDESDEIKGNIIIIKPIDKEMEYFLLNKCYLKTNSKIDTPFIQP